MKNLIECPICWHKEFKHKFYWKDWWCHTNKDKEYEIVECKKCRLEMIYPIPSIEEQWSFYPSDYYSYSNVSNLEKPKTIINKIWEMLYKITENKKLSLPLWDWKWKKFLDIWCGEWVNLKIMGERWWEAEWFEIWENALKNNIYYWGSIVDIDFWKKYDLIRCRHVFEHVCNPNEFLDKVYSLLSDGWIFIICLPNVEWFTSKIWWKYAAERDIPRHLFWYWYKNIQKLFLKHKFKISYKNYTEQYWSWLSLSRYFEDRYKIIIPLIILRFFYLLDVLLSFIKPTNSMWFILKK